jgi:uncharacterized membrane protein YeaQ/YmgE (transglycosylase-associated protein family)
VTGLVTAVALWAVGGWLGSQIAALFNRGNRLRFWGRLGAGVLGGVILGWTLDRVPLLEPMTRFLHTGHVEDAIAGVLGGFVVGTLAGLLAQLERLPLPTHGDDGKDPGA